MHRKIALEEHFMTPGFEAMSASFTSLMDQAAQDRLAAQLADFDDERIRRMERAGIERMILSQTAPGVQGEKDTGRAIEMARIANDFLASQIARHPDQFSGFAALAMQSPQAAVDELERTVSQFGFCGAMVNGHTLGQYYDDRAFDVVWERLQALDLPLYLHPISAFVQPEVFRGHPELQGAIWGWGVETGSHALRMLFGGVFDRFPRLKVILGHMGEGLPFMRWRFDSRFAVYSHGITLERKPSEYFGSNIFITTSGVCSNATLMAAIGEMGEDAVMFSVDYPYESIDLACDFIDQAPLEDAVRQKVCADNARRLMKL
ncbi:MAG: h16 [Devosia sp.]|nr:h16 [Devosia sp.]